MEDLGEYIAELHRKRLVKTIKALHEESQRDGKDAQNYDWYAKFNKAMAERDELRDLCVLLFDAVKRGNQVTDLPALWNKAEEVLRRTDPEKKQ